MDLEQLRQMLIAAARGCPPDDRVPFAFEKRVLARLVTAGPIDSWMLWDRMLWRAAGPCVAIMCAMTLWTAVSGDWLGSDHSLAAELEDTVLAPLHWEETW